MKKILIGLAIIPLALTLAGCSESQYDMAVANISEITYTYFYGKCEDFEISISSGQREEPYVYDGVSQDKCDFSLVVAKLNGNCEKENFIFSINGDASSQILEYNLMTKTYMTDLERKLEEDANISVKYGNTEIALECLSKEFNITSDQAIEIGVQEFSEDITNLTQSGQLKAETYLKVLDNLSNGYDSRFWCFSIVDTKGQHLNCIIDTTSGEIVART